MSVRTFLAGAFLAGAFFAPKAATVFVERTARVALGAATTGVPTREVMANIFGRTGRRCVYLNDPPMADRTGQYRRTPAKPVNFVRVFAFEFER